jgi:hypothetical protein
MNRKTFIKKATGAMLIGIPFYSVLSCSNSDDDPTPTPMDEKSCVDNGTVGSISANHGHSITVSKADVAAGVEKQYDISGSADHDHSVTVSESDFASLKNNQQISVTSTSGGGHTHSVTVSCV